jgi:hypothetical protein
MKINFNDVVLLEGDSDHAYVVNDLDTYDAQGNLLMVGVSRIDDCKQHGPNRLRVRTEAVTKKTRAKRLGKYGRDWSGAAEFLLSR